MARFNRWANERLYECVAGLPEAERRAERGAFFGSIHRTLNHLLVVDRLWMARFEGTDAGIRTLDEVLYDDFAGLRAAREAEDQRLIALVDRLAADDLTAPVAFRMMTAGGTHTTRRDYILITLYNHQTHHRGQVHALVTRAGVRPPPLDVIVFLGEEGVG